MNPPGDDAPAEGMTAGGALLARLRAVGVDYLFANSGTDFPPIIEGLAEAAAKDVPLPQALVMPHESAALGMAHGYVLATGKAQAVMLHTNVGLANGAAGAINAATDGVPMLLFSGRTPLTERGRFGARTVPIGWGQEMRDQTALVREAAKWDYELRYPEQAPEAVDRAHAIAQSTPKGPVYIGLPREVLCAPCPAEALARPVAMRPARTAPHPADIAKAADWLADAERPLIVAQRGAGSPAGKPVLAGMALDWALPVSQYWATRQALATTHPMHVGPDVGPWVERADAILVLDGLSPWSPRDVVPPAGCRVIQAGPDPLRQRFPVRNFAADLALPGETEDVLAMLSGALAARRAGAAARIAGRRARVVERAKAYWRDADAAAQAGSGAAMRKAWVGRCLAEIVNREDAQVTSELGAPLASMRLERAGVYFQEPHSGGLGWAFPCALGLKLAQRERLIVATMGDGSYIFANPVACHQIACAHDLPILVLVLNNAEWGAVRASVLDLYPDGYAARANVVPLTSLAPAPDFAAIARAAGAHAERVEDGAKLPAALERAVHVVQRERRTALLDLAIGG